MSMLDFNNLPPSQEVLGIIAEMTLDDVLANLNAARTMALALPAGEVVSQEQQKVNIMLARRVREMRATSRAKKTTTKKKTVDAPLTDLLNGI